SRAHGLMALLIGHRPPEADALLLVLCKGRLNQRKADDGQGRESQVTWQSQSHVGLLPERNIRCTKKYPYSEYCWGRGEALSRWGWIGRGRRGPSGQARRRRGEASGKRPAVVCVAGSAPPSSDRFAATFSHQGRRGAGRERCGQ